jgi:hypothetical protein
MNRLLATSVVFVLLPGAALAQFKQGVSQPQATELGQSVVQRWKAGVIVTAGGGPCQGIVATFPVPVEWPEQDVKVVAEDVSPLVKISDKFSDGVKQMVATMALVPPGERAQALITFEVTRRTIIPPKDTTGFQIPESRKLDRTVRPLLAQSPGIECRNPKIISLAKQITSDKEQAWDKVKAIFDWVRTTIQNKPGANRGAVAAIKQRQGNHEDLASAFIALCRAIDVPARTVWVPNHCYPEFYLFDSEGKGRWFPCEVAGEAIFGGTNDTRTVLEKGDCFRDPKNPRERMRYLPENLTGAGGRPDVKFVRQTVAE